MRATPLQVGMQIRGAGDDPDGCDKHSPPLWSFSVCIFSHLGAPNRQPGRGKIDRVGMSRSSFYRCAQKHRTDTRCFVCSHRVVQVKIETYRTRCPVSGAWASYRQKSDTCDPCTSSGCSSTM